MRNGFRCGWIELGWVLLCGWLLGLVVLTCVNLICVWLDWIWSSELFARRIRKIRTASCLAARSRAPQAGELRLKRSVSVHNGK